MTSAQGLPAWLQPEPVEEIKPAGVIEDSMSYEERLFHYTYATRNDEPHFLEFRVLQRLNIFRLQNRLATIKGNMWTDQKVDEGEFDGLTKTIHEYTTAIKDYAFTQSLRGIPKAQAAERQRDLIQAFPEIADLDGGPYNSRYCTLSANSGIPPDPLRNSLNRILPRRLTWTKAEMEIRFDEYLAGQSPVMISPFVDKTARFIIAFMGGSSLVVPMLIMSLPSTNQTKSLVTVSVAVTLFALLLSSGIRTSNSETLVSTATYAAVLVVFVGTSSSSVA